MDDLVKSGKYLEVNDPTKSWVKERVVESLTTDLVGLSFSEAALQLCAMSQNENATMEEFAQVISLDPALTTRSIQVAGSIGFCARPIDNIDQALAMIGVQEIRRIAFAVGTMDAFSQFKDKIDWKRFWFHDVLVARLTDKVAACFRRPTGMEYLAGLLHDVGKLILERYFPREFEIVLAEGFKRQSDHAAIEKELLGLDHAQIGAALCDRLEIHPHILRAVLYHHDPLNVRHTEDPAGDGGFLAACIAVANRLAHVGTAPPGSTRTLTPPVEDSAEWIFLNLLATVNRLHVNLAAEVQRTQEDLGAFLG